MYTPPYFKNSDGSALIDLAQKYSFATLISVDSERQLAISHLPLILETEGDEITKIVGHFALRNPQVKSIRQNNQVTVIFQGPHTYITPTWYRSGRDVPTWNYCVLHITGKLKFIEGFQPICNILETTTKTYEQGPKAWRFELPADLEDPSALTSAIIGFEITPVKIEAKFKLSQNRSIDDQTGMIEGLSERTDENSLEIQSLMKKNRTKIK